MRNAAVVASALALAACYRSARPAPPPPPANKAPAPAIRADDVLAFLPANSDLVVGLEMRLLRDSELFQHLVDRITPTESIKNSLAKAYACGIDPLHSLDRITLAGRLVDRDKLEGVLVIRGVDGPRTLDCVATFGATQGTVTHEHDRVLVRGNDGENEAATLVGRSVAVIQFGRAVDDKSLAATLASGAPLRSSRAFMGLFDRRTADAAVWGMVNGNASVLHQLRGMGLAPRSIDGAITVGASLSAVVRVTFATPTEADQLVQTTAPSLSSGKSLVDKLEVHSDGTSARFELAATEAQIEALWGMLGAMLGAFGGP